MALSTELYGLKSAGVYRFEKDQSVIQNTVEPLDNIRMLVGFSKIGPFNTPVLINTTKEFTDTFGDIDRSLEKKGAYFHRSCLAALSAGPIYALNLLKLTDEDKVSAMQFATSATCVAQTVNPNENMFDYRGMYNIDTFYTPSEESFLSTIGRSNVYIDDAPSTNDILSFTNIGKTPVSVIVTKASEYTSSSFDVTAQEWYGKGNVPEFMHDTSYMSDFMVDVYVISGDWGGRFDEAKPYGRFESDIKFSKYFDGLSGLKRRKNETDTTDTLLAQFLNEPDVNLIGKYTGSLIPGFVDKNGHNMYIEYLINSDTNVNGLMCAVNEQIFDGDVLLDGAKNGIDMVGNSLYDAMADGFSDVNFLSYSGNIADSLTSAVSPSGSETFEVVNENEYKLNRVPSGSEEFIVEFSDGEATGSDNFSIVKAWRNVNSKTNRLYAYYYDESDGIYVDMKSESTAAAVAANELDKIYEHVNSGKKAYVVYDDKLIPVGKVMKSKLYSVTDRTLPVDEQATSGSSDTIQKLLNDEYKNKVNNAVLNAHPIVKYVFEFKSFEDSNFEETEPTQYTLSTYFTTNMYVKNEDGKTTQIMFIEGSEVYDHRASLGDNDYIVLGAEVNPGDEVDINWHDNVYKITQIGNYTIDGNAYPDYVIAILDKDTMEYDLTDNSVYSFNVNGDSKALSDGLFINLGAKSVNTTITALAEAEGVKAQPNQFIIPINNDDDDNGYSSVKVGNYVVSTYGKDANEQDIHRLTRIVNITGISNINGAITHRLITCQDNVTMLAWSEDEDSVYYAVEVFNKLVDSFTHYNVFTLSGFSLKSYHMPDGTNERQHEILDLLAEDSEDSNLYNALIDRELIQFRYLVDTFGFGIEPMCKKQYTNLCQGRKSAFAIINMPSVNDFKNSQDPSFVDKNKSVSAEYIAKGGDPNTNPSFLFSLPDKVNGSTWGAYYYPYLKVYSNYTTINVPPAAYVSNNFVAKYGAGSPWTLVAGQNRGVISGNNVVGVESSLIRDNRDWLQPAGINSIIYQNNIGCVIYANKTAQQTPESALSSINCREACIYIQDGIEKILRNYLFETNTAQTRLEIKTLVDNFLDMVKNNGGVYDYKTIMDTSNNTNEVIDHNMGVIDVFIEPVRGLEILVQKLTILRTGAIESGTFE